MTGLQQDIIRKMRENGASLSYHTGLCIRGFRDKRGTYFMDLRDFTARGLYTLHAPDIAVRKVDAICREGKQSVQFELSDCPIDQQENLQTNQQEKDHGQIETGSMAGTDRTPIRDLGRTGTERGRCALFRDPCGRRSVNNRFYLRYNHIRKNFRTAVIREGYCAQY